MDEQLKKQQELYDRSWREAFEAGKADYGNLQTNAEFLEETRLLKAGLRVLEVGCGTGSLVSRLGSQGLDVTGVDISRDAIDYGLKKHSRIKLDVQPAENLEFADNSFDIVLSFDLFEHIVQVDRHLSEVSRVLATGGYYLFQTPNKYSNVIFETLAKKSLTKWRRAHPSLHTPGQLRRRLAGHGFESRFVKMNPVNEFFINKVRKKLGALCHIFKYINFRRLPIILQTNLYVIAHKL